MKSKYQILIRKVSQGSQPTDQTAIVGNFDIDDATQSLAVNGEDNNLNIIIVPKEADTQKTQPIQPQQDWKL